MKKSVLLLTIAVLLGAPVCSTALAQADMTILPSSLRGIVLWPDGETPVDDMRIHVWDADRERTVFKTRTNKNGVFYLPEFTEGNLFISAGPVRIDLNVMKAQSGIVAQPHAIVVILPKVMPFIPRLAPVGAATIPLLTKVSP